jgi:hypothetical protein
MPEWTQAALALSFVAVLPGCGARTELSQGSGEDSGQAADAGVSPDVVAACSVVANASDPCPSALLPGAPRAMLANCSTRDGRSRVVGPTSPHVTWSAQVIPSSDEESFMELAADASEGVYLVAGGFQANPDSTTASSFMRIDASTGHLDWSTRFQPLPAPPGLRPRRRA